MPYLAVDFDARKRAALIATSMGVHPGLVQWGLEEMWELGWRTKTDRIGALMLTGFFGSDERVVPLLLVHEFLEDLGDGSYRIRGASRYLRISETQSAAGKARAAKAKRDAAGRMCPAGQPSTSHRPAAAGGDSSRQPASSNSDHRAAVEDLEPLAGAVAPARESPPSAPIQNPTAPANVVQAPAQAVLDGVPERPAKAKRSKPDEKPTSPHFRALSDRLVTGYLRRVGRAYKFQGAKDGEALKRLCAVIDSGAATVEEVGAMFERALVVDFNPVTGIANFEARFNDPRWAADSAAPRDVRRGTVRAEDEHHEQGGSIRDF